MKSGNANNTTVTVGHNSLPERWKKVKLGESVDIGSSKRIFYKEYVNEGIPFYRSKEIIEKYIGKNISTDLFITEEKFNEVKEKFGVPKEGDLLLTSVGTLGIPYVVNQYDKFYFKDGNLTWFKNFNKNLYNIFLYYWILSPIGRNELEMSSIGSTQAALTIKGLKNLEIHLPPLLEQKAIARVLSSLDDKIDLLHRQNKTLEAMAETFFRQWFIEEVKEDWEKKILFDISEHKKVNIRPDKNLTIEYNHYSIPAFDKGKNPVKELGIEIKSNKYKIFENSILISKLNPRFPRVWSIWKEFKNKENSICSTEFQIVYPNKKEYFSFIYYLLKSSPVTNELIGAASGTSGSHQRVKPQDIFDISFLFNENKAIKFHDLVKNNLDKIKNNKTRIITLEQLRDTLLPKLMSGEVMVKYNE